MIDTTVSHSARVWNYWLGGKDHYPVDRETGERVAAMYVDEEVLAHISPAHSENINFFGAIEVDIESELAQLGPTGYRPLRVRDTLF